MNNFSFVEIITISIISAIGLGYNFIIRSLVCEKLTDKIKRKRYKEYMSSLLITFFLPVIIVMSFIVSYKSPSINLDWQKKVTFVLKTAFMIVTFINAFLSFYDFLIKFEQFSITPADDMEAVLPIPKSKKWWQL